MNQPYDDKQNVELDTVESNDLPILSPGEVILATFEGYNDKGQLLAKDGTRTYQALTTVDLKRSDVRKQVVLSFIGGDPERPIITGIVRSPLYDILDNPTGVEALLEELETTFDDESNVLAHEETVNVDGKRVCIEGAEEVSLKCGDASITLTKAGKLLLRGKYLSSRSTGVNKILGGSVQVN